MICGFNISYKLQSIAPYFEELSLIKIVKLIVFAIFFMVMMSLLCMEFNIMSKLKI
jgi:hypothetical protein